MAVHAVVVDHRVLQVHQIGQRVHDEGVLRLISRQRELSQGGADGSKQIRVVLILTLLNMVDDKGQFGIDVEVLNMQILQTMDHAGVVESHTVLLGVDRVHDTLIAVKVSLLHKLPVSVVLHSPRIQRCGARPTRRQSNQRKKV